MQLAQGHTTRDQSPTRTPLGDGCDGSLHADRDASYGDGAAQAAVAPGAGDQPEAWRGRGRSHAASRAARPAQQAQHAQQAQQAQLLDITSLAKCDSTGLPTPRVRALQTGGKSISADPGDSAPALEIILAKLYHLISPVWLERCKLSLSQPGWLE